MGLEALLQMGAKKNKFRAIPNCGCANSVTNTGLTMRNSKAFLVERWNFWVSSIAIVPIYIS